MSTIKKFFIAMFYPVFSLFLSIIIPEYIKKVIFITSVDAALFNLTINDTARLEVLNEHYRLINHSDALAFPVSITHYIWEQAFINNLLIEANAVEHHLCHADIPRFSINSVSMNESASVKLIAAKLAKNAPLWLSYGNLEERCEDILYSVREKMNTMHVA